MRRIFGFTGILIIILGGSACAGSDSGSQTPDESALLHKQVGELTSELLDGRIAIVRIYPDPDSDPTAFTKVRVPIRDHQVCSASVRADYPAISERAFIVILAADQVDKVVAAVLDRRVAMGPYSDELTLSLHIEPADSKWNPMWTFVDAQGMPLPGGVVEIHVRNFDDRPSVLLMQTTLDRHGQLPRMFPPGRFFFHVSHPNYGIGCVQLRQGREDPSGLWLVPLVPLDSQAVASSIQGTVVDYEGRPVPDAKVLCTRIRQPDGTLIKEESGFQFGALSDEQGWFSLCAPIVGADLSHKGLPEAGSSHVIDIEPPRQLNLRRYGLGRSRDIPVGTESTFTLTPIEATKVFHTFSFEYYEGPVTDPQELAGIELKLYRDNQQCTHLTYDQLKPGYALAPGTLRVTTTRWGRPFSFQDVELRLDTPEHVVIRGAPLVLYRGRVVDDSTDEPIRGAIIWGGWPGAEQKSSELTSERWQELLAMAATEADDNSAELLYRASDRVTATEGDGTFEIRFLPGVDPHIYGITVVKPGYQPEASIRGMPAGIDETYAHTVRLTPADRPDYFPTFTFEDENGSLFDPNELARADVVIATVAGPVSSGPLQAFLKRRHFTAGTYGVNAFRDGKYYQYGPVDLSVARPETVVFVPASVWQKQLLCRGRVIHGVTDEPIPGAIVIHCLRAPRYDSSSLQPSQWEAVERLGPNPDPKNPAMAPLFDRYDPPGPIVTTCATTDEDGWYHITVELSKPDPPDALLMTARNFLDSWHTLTRLVPAPDEPFGYRREPLAPNGEGIIQLSPVALFPAGTVVLQPIAPDLGLARADGSIEFRWIVCEDPRPPWVEQLWPPFGTISPTMPYHQRGLRPNLSQTIYVPAGLDLRLIAAPRSRDSHPPVDLGYFRFEQGQVIKLGRVEFPPGLEVTVCVVDEQGHPVGGAPVYCFDENEMVPQLKQPTDEKGMTAIRVAPHSRGHFLVQLYDRQSRESLEESIPYHISGDEDAHRQFTLVLSSEMVQMLSRQARR